MSPLPTIRRKEMALRLIREGRTIQQIMEQTFYAEWTIYRLAQSAGLEVHRAPKRRRQRSEFVVQVRTPQKMSKYRSTEIRLGAQEIRCAGFTIGQIIRGHAEPGLIVLKAAD